MLKFSSKINVQRLNIEHNGFSNCVQKIILMLLGNKEHPSKIYIHKYLTNLKQFNTPSNSATRLRSVCLLTGRSRAVYRNFRMSRLKIREYANSGFFIGMSKSSW